jgi:sugar transferase (PEP-CTERM/EpsH1 system associated)
VADVLYLVHRIPFPPNKGDKVRSYNLLKCLAARHRVHVGTFAEPYDDRYADDLRPMCASLFVAPLHPRGAYLRSLREMLRGEALTLGYYRDVAMRRWVRETVARRGIEDAVIFSSAMMQYVDDLPRLRVLLDCVDVDSAKWTQYAHMRRWPLSMLWRREGQRLLAYEAKSAARAVRTYFVTDAEARLFARLAPGHEARIATVCNGVDSEFFSPEHRFDNPFGAGRSIVFVGAMDYWPNVDAARWFVTEVLPSLRDAWPDLRFHIVGMRPAAAVRALAAGDVVVSGTVPDVRPYLQHADVVVAPLRVARGVQNKILEAMAMGRPVVASAAAASGVDASPGSHVEFAADAPEFVRRIGALLADPAAAATMGRAARERILERYRWDRNMAEIVQSIGRSDPPSRQRVGAAIGGRSEYVES